MKLHNGILLLALVVIAIAWPVQRASAQAMDTLTVQWGDKDGVPIANALRDAVVGDTVAGGARKSANRVYKLLRGGFYWNTERIENSGFTLRLVGEIPGTKPEENPAVIQMVARANGTVDGRIITGLGSVTLKNLWLTGRDDNNVQTYYQPIQMDANNSTFIIDNCILERTNFALIAFTGKGNKISFTNCKFRNLIGQPSTQQWEGRGISIWADQDTVIVENNSFFNLEFTAFQLEGGSAKYVRFNHNTMVNHGRNVNTGNWFQEAYFTNNLLINGFWQGEGYADLTSANRDTFMGRPSSQSGMFSIGALPSQYGPEKSRRIVFANMASWRDPKFKTFYGDSIAPQFFSNSITNRRMAAYASSMVFKDTTWLTTMPNLMTYPDTLVPKMIANINDLRRGITPAAPYFFATPPYPTEVPWPLPEDFSYTTPKIMKSGTDGLPLGDLNWFPAKKALFEAGKAGFIKQIEDLAGEKVKLEVIATTQAENMALSGTAAVSKMTAFTYFQMDGGGFMEWNFNLAAAATVDLKVWTHLRNNSTRGEFIKVNGINIRNNSGYGEFAWAQADGIPINEWTWLPTITKALLIEGAAALDLPKGANTIRIEKSWGWQNFAGIDILAAGTTTVLQSLRATDISSYELVMPKAEGAKWTPAGFKSVALGASGTLTWTLNVAEAGTYRLGISYQNVSGAQTGTVKVGATTIIAALPLASNADSTGLDLLTGLFNLAAGSQTFTLTAAQANIDQIQLIQEISTSVPRNVLPEGYALEQNFPNPFNPSTTIRFSLGKASDVKLTVFNILGQRVITLIDGRMKQGAYAVQFDASRLSSGIYFYRLEAGDVMAQRRMLFIK